MFRYDAPTGDAPRSTSAPVPVQQRAQRRTGAGLVEILLAALTAARPGRGD